MQAVILAAGRGTRMGPLTETMPKPMLPVADKPLVAHVADAAAAAGADELVFTVGFGGDRVRTHFGTEYAGIPVTYAEQRQQLGTADALAAAADLIHDDFAVLNGDSLYRATDLARLFESVPQVGAFHVDDPSAYGVLVTDDGVVSAVQEKPSNPASTLINAGAYAFPADTIELLDVPKSERGERELTDVLERIIDRDELHAVVFDAWMDVGRPWELLEANERRLPGDGIAAVVDTTDSAGVTGSELTDGNGPQTTDCGTAWTGPQTPASDGGTEDAHSATHLGKAPNRYAATVHPETTAHSEATVHPDAIVHPDATIRGDVVIEAEASIGPGVVIDGPALVRSGASIGPNAYVRGATLLGQGAHIGHAVEIKNSVVMANASIGHLSYVGDSVLGRDVNLGAGTNVANLRHDDEPVVLTVNGSRTSTGRRKFGTVLGPGVKTGIQTGINAGVTLSAGTRTKPGEIVTRDR